MATNFGAQRPGSDPPPRQPLTPEEIRYRETFTRSGHLAQNGGASPAQPGTAAPPPPPQSKVFDEFAIRAALRQEGMEFAFQIFPVGEKPPEGGPGAHARREERLAELESERVIMRTRTLSAESAAAGSIRDLNELQVRFDTLQGELEAMKLPKSKKKREGT